MLLGCPLLSILAQESSSLVPNTWSDSPYMFGDWGGERTRLANVGVVLNVIYVNDLLADTQGTLANWSRVRGTLDVDFGKAALVQGLTFHITAMWQAGGNLGLYLGTIANPSSNASFNLLRLDSWWFEQALANNKVFVRAGQFAGWDSYGVQQYGESYLMEPRSGTHWAISLLRITSPLRRPRLPLLKSDMCPPVTLREVRHILRQPQSPA